MLSLDEAIKHCEEKAEELEKRVKPYQCESINKKLYEVNKKEWDSCVECAKEHRQLAEWLRELKKYRIAHYKLRDMDYEYDFNSKFKDNPMYYGEKVWDLFGDIDASVEYEVMGYEEVNADEPSKTM